MSCLSTIEICPPVANFEFLPPVTVGSITFTGVQVVADVATVEGAVLLPNLEIAAPEATVEGPFFVVSRVGYSAYEVAVQEGFVGTVEEWLESLIGPEGDSAYEVAVANGFVGTEAQWLASLEGDPGPQGSSAYQVALAEGFVGTVEEWLESLIGPQGFNGWSPILAVENDGARRVLRVVDWTGGSGTEPVSGLYIGVTGLVADIADAVDIRGPQGLPGNQEVYFQSTEPSGVTWPALWVKDLGGDDVELWVNDV